MTPGEEILFRTMAPLQRSVANYGDAHLALAMHQRARAEQQMDAAQRHQQAMALLGLQHQNAMAVRKAQDDALMDRQKQQDTAMLDRGMALLGERELAQDVDEVEARNRDRDSLYETAAAYGFKIDPEATPEQNQRKASRVLEDEAVKGYKNLVGERSKIKDEIDELLTPIKVSDSEVAKALATDPLVAAALDKKQLAMLAAGQTTVAALANKVDKDEREILLTQAEAVRTKLEEKVNTEHQRKAMVKARELSNRHDELSTAIGAAQKSIPAHRLGEAYIGATKTSETDGKKAGGGKEAFAEELKKLLGGGGTKPSTAPVLPAGVTDMPPELMGPPLPPSAGIGGGYAPVAAAANSVGRWLMDKMLKAAPGGYGTAPQTVVPSFRMPMPFGAAGQVPAIDPSLPPPELFIGPSRP